MTATNNWRVVMVGRPPESPLARFWRKVKKTDEPGGCWLWSAGLDIGGYGRFYDGAKEDKAHRYSYRIHSGPIPAGAYILHSCDVRACVNPDHLIAGSHLDNMRHMRARERQCRGARTNTAKLQPNDVVCIRERFASGAVSQSALAREYGLSSAGVSHIVRGSSWRHVGGPRTAVGRGRRPKRAPHFEVIS